MGKVKSWIMDNVEKFYTIADNTASECETYMEFVERMKPHMDLLTGSDDADEITYVLGDIWDEKWSKYH